ncbi:hypothetical protein [Luteolibacter sp. LG18]|uniref:hypothetical protein n=1 Tax=Luteolibacter sp. LG18 TaxID=2819286 RepID=UPI002B28D1B1|nr:hypothetical protein llg_09070 [Luteolibacter sp. LG18]
MIPIRSSGPTNALALWVIWFAILSGLVMIQMIAGGGISMGPDKAVAPLVPVVIATGGAFASMVVRFLVLPRVKLLEQKLPLMIVGLALAESGGMMSAFLVPTACPRTRLWLFLTAVTCIVLHAPVYANAKPGDGGYTR